jgi:hypothetical protein
VEADDLVLGVEQEHHEVLAVGATEVLVGTSAAVEGAFTFLRSARWLPSRTSLTW